MLTVLDAILPLFLKQIVQDKKTEVTKIDNWYGWGLTHSDTVNWVDDILLGEGDERFDPTAFKHNEDNFAQ